MKVKVAQSCPALCDPMDYAVHGILQARILEWVAFPFSRGTFPTQRSNPGLLHCRQILYQLSHKGSPTILEWVAYPFSRGSSRPRNRTRSLIRPLLKCLPSFFSQKVPSYLCKSCSQWAHQQQMEMSARTQRLSPLANLSPLYGLHSAKPTRL